MNTSCETLVISIDPLNDQAETTQTQEEIFSEQEWVVLTQLADQKGRVYKSAESFLKFLR